MSELKETWAGKIYREHPWRMRWLGVKYNLRMAWDWILDKPYWCDQEGDMVLLTLRTKQPYNDEEK